MTDIDDGVHYVGDYAPRRDVDPSVHHTMLLNAILYELAHYGPQSLLDIVKTLCEQTGGKDAKEWDDIGRLLDPLIHAVRGDLRLPVMTLFTCPTHPQPYALTDKDCRRILGCGHSFAAVPDGEGLVDCPACGIWFKASEPGVLAVDSPVQP